MKESTMPILETLKNLMSPSQTAMGRIMCHSTPSADDTKRIRNIRQNCAKSKSGIWGPTHSQDSEDQAEGDEEHQDSSVGPQTPEAASPPETLKEQSKLEENNSLLHVGVWNCASATIQDFLNPPWTPCNVCRGDESKTSRRKSRGEKTTSDNFRRESDPRTSGGPLSTDGPLSQTIYLASKNSNTSSLTFGMKVPQGNKSEAVGASHVNKVKASDLPDLWQPPPPPTTPTPKSQRKVNASINYGIKEGPTRGKRRAPPPFHQIKVDSNVDFFSKYFRAHDEVLSWHRTKCI
jgi:hypothetical protein